MDSKTFQRFMDKVECDGTDGCWEWVAAINMSGYGTFQLNGNKQQTHRVSYAHFCGDIPDGKIICHNCDNRRCVNPWHLKCATHKDNSNDMVRRNRSVTGKDHYCCRFTHQDILHIRQSPMSQRKLAEKYGVSRRTIENILHRRTWRHI